MTTDPPNTAALERVLLQLRMSLSESLARNLEDGHRSWGVGYRDGIRHALGIVERAIRKAREAP
jgi:hypothetical protein